MILRCKRCGEQISLTEAESSQIAADLDRRYTWEQQATLVISAVCADCWPGEEHRRRHESVRRVQVVSQRT